MFPMDERDLGANIRAVRQGKGLTVTDLAARAQLTKSAVSKIERGQHSAPISTLMRLAGALNVTLAELFVEPNAKPPYVLTRAGHGKILTRDGSRYGYAYEALALDMPDKRIEPFVLTIQPGDPAGEFQHGGQEFIYMLSGRMQFTVGDATLTLGPGDSLYFDPTHVHTTRVLGKKPARFLCTFVQDQSLNGRSKT